MSNFLQPRSATFYDPLYDVVVFSSRDERGGSRAFWAQGAPDEHAATSEHLLRILQTYEFSRLSNLKQAGLMWLAFPSATHTRFSHALGCWLLSDLASDNVFVYQGRVADVDVDDDPDAQSQLVRLGAQLRSIHWLEEFQLSLLLHDIGHFPYSHVLENNDLLKERYREQEETKGIQLCHEQIGCSLIQGGNPVASLFRDYIESRVSADCVDESQFCSSVLRSLPKVDVQRIVYLLDACATDEEATLSTSNKRFVRAVRQLVSGVIDLDRLDHYRRDAHFASFHVGEFNVQGILHHMAIVDGDKFGEDREEMRIQLMGDGVSHAFQMLFAKTDLTKSVFHSDENLAYEVMLNHAVNAHWLVATQEFRRRIPFMDDGELFNALISSESAEAKEMASRIWLRQPLACAGRFIMGEEEFARLGGDKVERRDALQASLRQELATRNLNRRGEHQDCFVRLSSKFGAEQDGAEWMDLGRVLGDDGRPLRELEDHEPFIQFVHQQEVASSRIFWVFVRDVGKRHAAREAAIRVGATAARRVNRKVTARSALMH